MENRVNKSIIKSHEIKLNQKDFTNIYDTPQNQKITRSVSAPIKKFNPKLMPPSLKRYISKAIENEDCEQLKPKKLEFNFLDSDSQDL